MIDATLSTMLVLLFSGVLGIFGYSWFTRSNPSKLIGIATGLTTSGVGYATSALTGFIHVITAAVAGGFGYIGYIFILVWFAAIPLLWIYQGLNGWYHDRPFLASMIR